MPTGRSATTPVPFRISIRCFGWIPTSVNAFYDRGSTYEYTGGYDRAILDFDQALKLTPNDPDAFHCRSRAYARKGDYLRAMADRNHYLWPRFGTVRLILLAVMVAAVFGFISISKRFR